MMEDGWDRIGETGKSNEGIEKSTGIALIIISPKLSLGDLDIVLSGKGIEGAFAAREHLAGVAVA